MRKSFFLYIGVVVMAFLLASCGSDDDKGGKGGEVAYNEAADRQIQDYNLEQEKGQSQNRTPCDTLALKEFILNNYPSGTYLVDLDRTLTFNVPKSAVIYYKGNTSYVFAVIAKSKSGERLIETKNIIGYESSFINLDSTKLGTAFFFLALFKCNGDQFEKVWESLIPIHGGFNRMYQGVWRPKNIPFIATEFEDGLIVGHRNFNFFLVNGLDSLPHLLETYIGISSKRTMANLNDDRIPDYYEYVYYDVGSRIYPVDSVPFLWNAKKRLYINKRNPRQTRMY